MSGDAQTTTTTLPLGQTHQALTTASAVPMSLPPELASDELARIKKAVADLYPHHHPVITAAHLLTKDVSCSSVWLLHLSASLHDATPPAGCSDKQPPAALIVRLVHNTSTHIQQQTHVHTLALNLLHQHVTDPQLQQQLPTILHSDEYVVLESCMNGVDLSSLTSRETLADNLWLQLGKLVEQIHSVDVRHVIDFGSLQTSNGRLHGSHHSWEKFIATSWQQRLHTAAKQHLLTSAEITELDAVFHAIGRQVHAEQSHQHVLLHGDINSSNIRVKLVAGVYEFSGLIDFGDCMLGDPLFDAGRLYSHLSSNALFADLDDRQRWRIINQLMHSNNNHNQACTREECCTIIYYALWYTLWLLTLFGIDNQASRHKYRKTLLKLREELQALRSEYK